MNCESLDSFVIKSKRGRKSKPSTTTSVDIDTTSQQEKEKEKEKEEQKALQEIIVQRLNELRETVPNEYKVKEPKVPKEKVPKEPKEKIVKEPKAPKEKVPKEPKEKVPRVKEPKEKVPKEPKEKVPRVKEPKEKVPRVKEPKEKVPKEPKEKVPKEPKEKVGVKSKRKLWEISQDEQTNVNEVNVKEKQQKMTMISEEITTTTTQSSFFSGASNFTPLSISNPTMAKPNIILHLKCFTKDLSSSSSCSSSSSFESAQGETSSSSLALYNLDDSRENEGEREKAREEAKENEGERDQINANDECNDVERRGPAEDKSKKRMAHLHKKLKQLESQLHRGQTKEQCCCFWDTCEFDHPPVYIPKFVAPGSGVYHVYGCFCSPECAMAYLMHEPLDMSTKFQRCHLLNVLYAQVYSYTKNIREAPLPFYMLDKFLGNMTIDEYRALFAMDKLLLIIDKPITRLVPELHEDNDDFIINNKSIVIAQGGGTSFAPSSSLIVPTTLDSITTSNILNRIHRKKK